MTNRKKIVLGGGLIVVIAALVVVNLTMSDDKATAVQIEKATRRTLVETVSANGRVQPQTKVNITSQINAEIKQISAKEGDQVKAGQLLVILDSIQIASDVEQARYGLNQISASLNGAKTRLDQAEEEFKRQEQMFSSNLTSDQQFKDAKYAFLNAKSNFEATDASAKQARAQFEKQLDYLRKTRIAAPMAGVVTLVDCEVGEIAAAQTSFTQGKTLMTLSDLDVFEVEVEVDETEVTKVTLGQLVKIEVDAFPDTSFAGEVIEIGNTAIMSNMGSMDQSTNFKVKVIFKEVNDRIRPGMSATVDITTNSRELALAVPYSAVIVRSFDIDSLERAKSAPAESSGAIASVQAADNSSGNDTMTDKEERKELKGVFVVRNGKAEFVEIATGIADQKNIEVTSGLQAGDSLIAGPYAVLRTVKEGDAVKSEKKPDGEKK
ncbi:MAG: efflux RND transporter periplasmic adaptor subunit [Candidatus Zixiibacteriota bacterium]